ncbi:MAG: VOC family protein [Acidimicrobiia bacterium]
MQVESYQWVGLLADDFEGTLRFFSQVLGFELEDKDDDKVVAMFRLPSGQQVEVFGPGNRDRKRKYRLMNGPVVGLQVPDVAAARRELIAQGFEFVTEVEESDDGASWAYFIGPDQRLYSIQNTGP